MEMETETEVRLRLRLWVPSSNKKVKGKGLENVETPVGYVGKGENFRSKCERAGRARV